MSDRVRVFFALPVPDAAKGPLLEAQARMKRRAGRSSLSPRWTREQQLHVTLKFLGPVDPEHIPALCSAAAQLGSSAPPVDTLLDELGAFGSVRRARVLVAHVADAEGVIEQLAQRVELVAEEFVPRETRDFRAHVTLARIKRPGDVSDWLDAARFEPIPLRFTELVLYRSELEPTGSVYTALARQPLGAARVSPG